jgi:hypothetical protein
LLGWNEACLLQSDATWAAVLLSHYREDAPAGLENLDKDTLPRLFALLDQAQREKTMTAVWRRRGAVLHEDWAIKALDSMNDGWSEAFARELWDVARANYFVSFPLSVARAAAPTRNAHTDCLRAGHSARLAHRTRRVATRRPTDARRDRNHARAT